MAAKLRAVLRSTWPPASVGLAVFVNCIWIIAIGYGISMLF